MDRQQSREEQIMARYFGKHFSLYGRLLFGRWLRAENGREAKERALEACWTQTEAKPNEETKEEWERLERRLCFSWEPGLQQVKKQSWMTWGNVAAVGLLLIASSVVTYLITRYVERSTQPNMLCRMVDEGMREELLLPDSTRVIVEPGSWVLYADDLGKRKQRMVYLTGKACFDVSKDARRPFIVRTAHMDVQALGTVFTVEAYTDDSLAIATLEEGRVRVTAPESGLTPVELTPDHQLVYNHRKQKGYVRSVDASIYNKVHSGYLVFDGERAERMLAAIGRRYGVDIAFDGSRLPASRYHVKFAPGESLHQVMEVVSQLMGMEYVITQQKVILR